MKIKTYMQWLGYEAKDLVTGFEGIIECVNFDLYGCVQYIVRSKRNKDNESHSEYFDVTRIKIMSKKPVMSIPNFEEGYTAEGKKGAASKPCFNHSNPH